MSWMERSSSGRFGRGRMRMIGYPTAWLSSSCICLECQYVGLRGRSAKLERAHFTSSLFFLWPNEACLECPNGRSTNQNATASALDCNCFPGGAWNTGNGDCRGGGSVAFSPMSEHIVTSAFMTNIVVSPSKLPPATVVYVASWHAWWLSACVAHFMIGCIVGWSYRSGSTMSNRSSQRFW